MRQRALRGLLAVGLIVTFAAAGAWAATPVKKVLVYDHAGWFVHPDIGVIDDHLKKMGADNGFTVTVSSDPKVFDAATLAPYQVVVLNNISEMGTSVKVTAQRDAFQKWIEGGGGVVAFHGSGVVRGTWDWYIKLLGTDWYYDAFMQEARVFIPPKGKDHPISAGALQEGKLTDEWNNFMVNVDTVAGISVMLAVDESSYDPTHKKNASEGNNVPGFPMADPQGKWVHPISWVREGGLAGKGKVFYSCIGHDLNSFGSVFATQHFLRAIQWAGGQLEAATAISRPGQGSYPGGAAAQLRFTGSEAGWTGAGAYTLEFFTPAGRQALAISGMGPGRHSLQGRLQPGLYQIRIRTEAGLTRFPGCARVGF
ncbi:MAG: ThuA domain-containing protein [Fibrobacteria bacterium]